MFDLGNNFFYHVTASRIIHTFHPSQHNCSLGPQVFTSIIYRGPVDCVAIN